MSTTTTWTATAATFRMTAVLDRVRRALALGYGTTRDRVALAATAVTLLYGCGVVMFWVHAVHRRELGPPIADVYHWFLDSTLGFVALTPVVALLLPLTSRALGARHVSDSSLPLVRYSLLVGCAFALVTAPGPLLHNVVAGAGTPLAELATAVVGSDPDVVARSAHAHAHSAVEEGIVQLVVGAPMYSLGVLLVTGALRALRVIGRPASQAGVASVDPYPTPALASSTA